MIKDHTTSILVYIIVKGLVQGVSFRAYTKRKALSLSLTGYVQNLPNGDVKIVAEGEKEKLYELIKWLRQKGSPGSNVTDLNINWSDKKENFSSFRIEY
ncbi:MAG TPA: acylphosphatase [candidate division Zixibacteria bacterium]|nr:acylphosphatase [candidate division Zixibacteria bacterium]